MHTYISIVIAYSITVLQQISVKRAAVVLTLLAYYNLTIEPSVDRASTERCTSSSTWQYQ
jgi:hypothetical protein